MEKERLIQLVEEFGEGGTVYVSSPQLPLFHVSVKQDEDYDAVVLPIVKATLERQLGQDVDLRWVSELAAPENRSQSTARVPAHIIAQMAA